MCRKNVLTIVAVAVFVFAFAIGQVQANTVTVPNCDFETIYKPDSTVITGELSSVNWTQGVGPDCPIDVGQYNFSDETSGTVADIPGWLGYDKAGWVYWGGTYGRDETTGNLQGSIANQANHTTSGLNCYLANGGSWGNSAGGLITSAASLGNILTNTSYTLSMYAKGAATPVVLKLLAGGTELTPSSSVSPTLTSTWQQFSRTYDAQDLTSYVGQTMTIVLGVDRDASGTQTQFDDVSLSSSIPSPGEALCPMPYDGMTAVAVNADLAWTQGEYAVSSNVYFGTDSTPDSGEFKGNQTPTTYDPGTLTAETTYYWRIDQVNAQGTTTGDVWTFTTHKDSASTVKVFILAGQSNMEGHGEMNPITTQGTLEYIYDDDPVIYGHLKESGNWAVLDDVWIWYTRGGTTLVKGGLTAGYGAYSTTIGPELQFGHVMGDFYDEQVLLIKTAWGGKSLAVDFRPPTSGWDINPPVAAGDEGYYYQQMLNYVVDAMANIETYFPAYDDQGYEIAGFGWHQGWNDRVNQTYTDEYEENMENFIIDVRASLGVPDMPFVIATTGMAGWEETHPRALQLMEAQLAMEDYETYPQFEGNVSVVDTRDFWRDVEESPADQSYHWNRNAETYYLIGESIADEMTDLIELLVTVPNCDFETIYKPNSTTITADISSGGWTQGVGPDCPIDNGQYNFSDETSGTLADIPGWLGYDKSGWVYWGGTYNRDETTGNLQGSVQRGQNHTSGGLNCYLANGGSWGNSAGGLITSDASLGNVLTGATYTLSMYAKGAATPVVLKLLANGTVLTPSSSVSPTLTSSWQEFSRTYDDEDLTSYIGQSLTIVLGVDRDASGTQTQFDDVLLRRCYGGCE